MNRYSIYAQDLNNLIENQNNISFFCNIIKGNIRNNVQYCNEIIDYISNFCIENNLEDARGYMLYYSTSVFFQIADFTKALELCNEAKVIFEKNDNKEGLALSYNGLSIIYSVKGYEELSNEYSLKGISIAKQIDNKEILYKILMNVASYNVRKNDIDNAIEILNYVELNFDKTEKYLDIIMQNITFAQIKIEQGKIEEAKKYLNEAIILDTNKGISRITSELYKLLAICSYKNNKKDAEKYFLYSLNLANKNDDIYEKCEILLEFGKYKFKQLDNEGAINDLKKSLDIAMKYEFIKIVKKTSNMLYKYYKKIEDYESSLEYLEIYIKGNKKQSILSSNEISNKSNQFLSIDKKISNILYRNAEILFTIGQEIISKKEINNIISTLDMNISRIVDKDYLVISFYDEESNKIKIASIISNNIVVKDEVMIEDKNSFSAYCIKNKKCILINDFQAEYKKYVKKIRIMNTNPTTKAESSIYIPLIVNYKAIGTMSVQSVKKHQYSTDDLAVLKIIANYVAIACKNAIEFKKMEQIAVYDSLTGFLTRREILKEGNNIKYNYDKTKDSFCILMFDIDNFKSVNNTYGHVAGDQVLRMLTQTISSYIRESDYIGRYGGDEFLLLCPNATKENIIMTAERIRKVVENTDYLIDDRKVVKITLSIGLYEFNKASETFIDGVEHADKVLYSIKNTTKNAVVCC
ncbi:diguanylate cyclase [Sedimentibacter sp. zth1]|uniref:sensor domain-containing diguanylate cyclase n=1 Tax=Sedimentibacter sp. zth1 TaxID=2816908 RepID=UPI001A928B23|nr:sensor domain-containing diguanylate cyclase [Sedimentibacter sp. zth1]QSX05215.1 diguanylate cyclase [Sedimentibacter sp. zth1]